MIKRNRYVFFISLLATALILSNPGIDSHREAVAAALYKKENVNPNELKSLQSMSNWMGAGMLLNTYFINENIKQVCDTCVSKTNFGLFSLTQFSYKGQHATIGVGALGKVILWEDLEDKELRLGFE
ncbi:MAG: hypothetical protein IPP32_08335 [Bacteroidetes bacterium]|nr:hypothetical protein [Bacteroidota bacterium]